jgi:hypothetical protein
MHHVFLRPRRKAPGRRSSGTGGKRTSGIRARTSVPAIPGGNPHGQLQREGGSSIPDLRSEIRAPWNASHANARAAMAIAVTVVVGVLVMVGAFPVFVIEK